MTKRKLHSATQRGAFSGPLATFSRTPNLVPKLCAIALCALLAAFLTASPSLAKIEHPDQPWIDEALRIQRLESWRFPRIVRLVHPVKSTRRDDDDDDDDEEYTAAATRAQTSRHDAGYDVGALRGLLWAGSGVLVLLAGIGIGWLVKGRK